MISHDGEYVVHTIQSEGVDVFTVVWPGHIFLPETDGIFTLGDTIENLEVSLGYALKSTTDVNTRSSSKK